MGRGLFVTISLIFYAISMVILGLANTPEHLLWAAITEGTAGGLIIPMMLALMSDRSYDNERGKASALCIGGFDLGIAIAGPILGSLGIIIGYQGMFYLAGSCALTALLIFLTQCNKNLFYSFRFALGQGKDLYSLEEKISL